MKTAIHKACMPYGTAGIRPSSMASPTRCRRAAEAIYSVEGKKQVRDVIDYYLKNAGRVRQEMDALGFYHVGGQNSPYIWIDTKAGSWDFFDMLLSNAGVVCTPGAGFGSCGDQYIRISAFNSYEKVELAMDRLSKALKSNGNTI